MSTSKLVSRKTLSPQCSCTSAEPGSRALQHVVDGGKLLQIERHRRRDVLGFGARRRHAHRDEFADLAHLAGGQHRLLGNLEARQPRDRADRLDAGEIGRGEHAAAIALRRRAMPRMQRMRQRTAHEGDVLQCRRAGCRPRTGRARASAGRLPCAAAGRRRPVRRPPPAEGNSRSLRTVTLSSIELTLTSYAATACGRIGATAS